MALTVIHAHHTTIADDPNADVGADEWNAAHLVTGSVAAADVTGLATVATTGSAADLTGNLGVANLNGGLNADATHYWRGDATWAAISTGITVNTTAITGGTPLQLLYDNAGTVGETAGVTFPGTGILRFTQNAAATAAIQLAFAGNASNAQSYTIESGSGGGSEWKVRRYTDDFSTPLSTVLVSNAGTGILFGVNVEMPTLLVDNVFQIGATNTGLSQISAGVVGVGNGTAGSVTGTIKATLQTAASATTGLTPGVLAAATNASIVLTDGGGQVYRVPCII